MADYWEFPCTADEFLARWKQIPYQRIYPRHDEIILAVDASGKIGPRCGGAGVLLYNPELMVSGKCYQMHFLNDLNVRLDLNNFWKIEMFNLLFALCLFKKSLLNCNKLRIICDHQKIRNAKEGGALVMSIRKIIDHLKKSGTDITNDPYDLYEFRPESALDKVLLRVADRLSKGYPIPEFKDDYKLLKGVRFELLHPSVVQSFKHLFESEHGAIDHTEMDGRHENTGGSGNPSDDTLLIDVIAAVAIGIGSYIILSEKSKR